MTSNPLVSVIIPVKNGASTITKCLESIAKQTHKNIEVIVIDSGSEDGTVASSLKFPFVQVIQIPPHSFNHGTTRNLGVSKAKGDFVWLTVQDAYASSDDVIEKMLDHFLRDKEVVGVCGQQIVEHDWNKNPHEWFRPQSVPTAKEVQIKDLSIIPTLSPKEIKDMCGWDNVNSMYRPSVFKEFPFRDISFAEDLNWAKEVVLAGKKIVYDYNARVYHYHHSTYDYAYKRYLTVLYHYHKIFGYQKTIKYSLKDYLLIGYRNYRYKAPLKWILLNWKLMMAKEKASNDVRRKLEEGSESLDDFHEIVCKTPPQGKQNG